MLPDNLCIPQIWFESAFEDTREEESRWQNKDITKKRWHTKTMILLAQRQCSINSLTFIFLGYCGIQRIRPAQEKQRASKQAPNSAHSQKMLWDNETEAKGNDAVLQNTIFCRHLSTGAIAVWYTACYSTHSPAGRKQYGKKQWYIFLSDLLWLNNPFLISSRAEVTQNVTDWYGW